MGWELERLAGGGKRVERVQTEKRGEGCGPAGAKEAGGGGRESYSNTHSVLATPTCTIARAWCAGVMLEAVVFMVTYHTRARVVVVWGGHLIKVSYDILCIHPQTPTQTSTAMFSVMPQ